MWDAPILPLVVAVPVYILIGFTILDIGRRSDLAVLRKGLWIIAVVVMPVVGTFIYLLARPFEDPAHVTLRGNERTHVIVALLEQHTAGSLSDDEFAIAKHRVFDDAVASHRPNSS
jgi:hypothetical protein